MIAKIIIGTLIFGGVVLGGFCLAVIAMEISNIKDEL